MVRPDLGVFLSPLLAAENQIRPNGAQNQRLRPGIWAFGPLTPNRDE